MPPPFARRIFSGVQPTGRLHLGNYLGAVRQWVALQALPAAATAAAPATSTAAAAAPDPSHLLFAVVDLHAMTLPYDARRLHAASREMALSLLACGIDPSRATLFRQSAVREHAELAWVLGCCTPLGWLQRMTQYKIKAAAATAAAAPQPHAPLEPAVAAAATEPQVLAPALSGLGLLSYPVLQAADILLYRATHVPVGEDQRQHLELARDVAHAFNINFGRRRARGDIAEGEGCLVGGGSGVTAGAAALAAASTSPLLSAASAAAPVFPLPETLLISSGAARVMSLRDGSKKMSKSDVSDDSRVNLCDSADVIVRKVRAARTDSTAGFLLDAERRPEKTNLLGIFAALSGERVEDVAARFASEQASLFKGALAELVVERVTPIGREMTRLRGDPAFVERVLDEGAERARALARLTMSDVRALAGYA